MQGQDELAINKKIFWKSDTSGFGIIWPYVHDFFLKNQYFLCFFSVFDIVLLLCLTPFFLPSFLCWAYPMRDGVDVARYKARAIDRAIRIRYK